MPTLSTHVDDHTAEIIESAARMSPQKKVAPWLAESARQRIAREGLDSEANMAKSEILAIAEDIGPTEALRALREKFRLPAA